MSILRRLILVLIGLHFFFQYGKWDDFKKIYSIQWVYLKSYQQEVVKSDLQFATIIAIVYFSVLTTLKTLIKEDI